MVPISEPGGLGDWHSRLGPKLTGLKNLLNGKPLEGPFLQGA